MNGPGVVEGERGIPAPGLRRSRRTTVAAVVTLILVATAATVGALWWRLVSAGSEPTARVERTRTDLASSVPPISFPDPFEQEEEPPAEDDARTLASIDPMPLPEAYVPAPIPVIARAEPPPLPTTVTTAPRVLDRSATPIRLSQSTTAAPAATPAAPTSDAGGSSGLGAFMGGAEDGAGEGGNDSLRQRLTSTRLDATLAARLADRSLTITRGTMIDCVLATRLVSSLPGMTSCNVTRNVYSDDGRVLLLERGTEITGEYRSNVQQGTRRVFVLWSRAKTPTGVVVDLGSPATDALGATGVPGEVDNHFWTRFGGAILLSLVDDVASAAVAGAATGSDGTQVNVGGSINSGGRVVEEVLRQTINIPPTVSVAQGARVGVYVARDLDFRSVYRVSASR